MASAATQRMTIEEFERRYLGKRAELWRGEVREYMPAGDPILPGFQLLVGELFE